MGDMADYYVELGLNNGEGFAPRYREKRDYYGPRYSSDLPKPPKCKHCGATGLNWQQVKGSKWCLHEGAKPHVCKTTADGFEDEPT